MSRPGMRKDLGRNFGSWTENELIAHTEKFVTMVNLGAASHQLPRELSGGMRQRVSVARTLAMNPKVLLCDEPLSALDALTRANLQDEIARIRTQHNQTVILITNDPDEVILLADRVIPLTAGPNATLGPSYRVDIPHPRDRRAVNHDERFRRLRRELIEFLLGSRNKRQTTLTKNLILPDIEPEDLSAPRPLLGRRIRPVRQHEIKPDTIEV